MSSDEQVLASNLRSESAPDRLEAARYFASHSRSEHEPLLREALAGERVHWIRNALRRALARISNTHELEPDPRVRVERDDVPEAFASQVYAEAMETTTAQIIHEIEPLLGALRLSAEDEVPEFENSLTKKWITRLGSLVDALARLRRAASAPQIQEFSLDSVISTCIQDMALPPGVTIQRAGPQQCIVEGDSGLISLIVGNGLRNAVEATVRLDEPKRIPIVISWGVTNQDYWVSIIDEGIGFKGNLHKAFEIGTTTKQGHLGMGLAIAQQAVSSMAGTLLLIPKERGVRFEVRWPKQADL